MPERISTPPSNSRLPGRLKFWETRGGEQSPFDGIRDHVMKNGLPAAAEAERLATELKIPAATVRGVATYYADLGNDAQVAVCDGTACRLAGASKVCEALERGGRSVRRVYCLGHCDSAPAVLDQDGVTHLGEHAAKLGGGGRTVDVRSAVDSALVTRRLLKGGAPDLVTAMSMGCYESLAEWLKLPPEEIIAVMERSGERGRGGAAFGTGAKWRSCAETGADQRYVIANGDEGDPGSFIDRLLMEADPHAIVEGMIVCGYAVGASKGIVYIRSEYPRAGEIMRAAIADARKEGVLGSGVCGSEFDFDLDVFVGMGSYVCGEESAMINSIEGLRGEVQIRPPYPSVHGLYGKPTVVNNVETLSNVPTILRDGAEIYAALGTSASKGTKVISLNHGFARPGLVEVEFGTTLREVIEGLAGGGRDGEPLAAVIVGGPMGSVVLPKDWDLPICYEVLSQHGIQFGHGGIIALPESADFLDLLEHLIESMIEESCGKCVPCRLGSECAKQALKSAGGRAEVESRLDQVFTAMEQGSLCAFGEFMPGPMRQLIEHFGDRIFNTPSCHA